MNRVNLLLSFLLFFQFAQAQEKISGKVIDAISSEPLAFYNIIIEGTTRGCITNEEGTFVLKVDLGIDNSLLIKP